MIVPAAERWARTRRCSFAVVIPLGLGAAFGQTGFGGPPVIVLLVASSVPVVPNMVGGLLQ